MVSVGEGPDDDDVDGPNEAQRRELAEPEVGLSCRHVQIVAPAHII